MPKYIGCTLNLPKCLVHTQDLYVPYVQHIHSNMPIEMTSEQMGLGRKKAIDNACLHVGIIICLFFLPRSCLFLLVILPRHMALHEHT